MDDTALKSPFKFLDSYGVEDRNIFFGREAEIEELYDRIFETDLILLYGDSGSGKTSLVNCGLYNQFEETDWLPISIRREENLLASLDRALAAVARTAFPEEASPAQKVRSLYLDFYQPVYLIFDQFEELFVLGDEEEQLRFFEAVKALLHSERNCKILISMRGEYLDKLSKYELVIPSLFDNRLYLERMSRRSLREVVLGTAEQFGIELAEGERTVDQIIENITSDKGAIELASLQIYLDKLYRNDLRRRGKTPRPIRFDAELIQNTKHLEDVLSDFLQEQLDRLEAELAGRGVQQKNVPMSILFALVTEDGTKQTLNARAVQDQLQQSKGIAPEDVAYCIQRFHELRIIRTLGSD